MKYEEVFQLMENGGMVRRESWKENIKFVFRQVPATISKDIVPKMQSLPQAVKDYFQTTFDNPKEQISAIYYSNQFAIVGQSNMICGWMPMDEDFRADDWIEVD